MNAQFTLLVDKAWKYAADATKDFSDDEPIGFMDYYSEKLIELTVNQCANVVDTLDSAYGAQSTSGIFIKDYFGVE